MRHLAALAALPMLALVSVPAVDHHEDTSDELEALLLTDDDLPTGWSAEAAWVDPTYFLEQPCGPVTPVSPYAPAEPRGGAAVGFTVRGVFDHNIVVHYIVDYGDTELAYERVHQLPVVLVECRDDVENPTEMAFAQFGDITYAARLGFAFDEHDEDQHLTPTVALVAVAVGELVVMLTGTAAGSDTDLLEQLMVIALDRVEDFRA